MLSPRNPGEWFRSRTLLLVALGIGFQYVAKTEVTTAARYLGEYLLHAQM